jgi:hypothetical protein
MVRPYALAALGHGKMGHAWTVIGCLRTRAPMAYRNRTLEAAAYAAQ